MFFDSLVFVFGVLNLGFLEPVFGLEQFTDHRVDIAFVKRVIFGFFL